MGLSPPRFWGLPRRQWLCPRVGDPREGRGDVAILPTRGPTRRQGLGSHFSVPSFYVTPGPQCTPTARNGRAFGCHAQVMQTSWVCAGHAKGSGPRRTRAAFRCEGAHRHRHQQWMSVHQQGSRLTAQRHRLAIELPRDSGWLRWYSARRLRPKSRGPTSGPLLWNCHLLATCMTACGACRYGSSRSASVRQRPPGGSNPPGLSCTGGVV